MFKPNKSIKLGRREEADGVQCVAVYGSSCSKCIVKTKPMEDETLCLTGCNTHAYPHVYHNQSEAGQPTGTGTIWVKYEPLVRSRK